MEQTKVKFKVHCYLRGYQYWTITVHDGSFEAFEKYYLIKIKDGKNHQNTPIINKIFRFPFEITIIEENVESDYFENVE